MKSLRIILSLALIAGLVSCSSVNVKTDYDRELNFSNLKTFDWMAHPQNSSANPLLRNTLLEQRVQSAVTRELAAKGYQKASGQADFLIAYHAGLQDKVDVTSWGYAYGRRGRYWANDVTITQYTQGTLVLDFVDAKSKELVWRGWATGVVGEPKKAQEKIDQAVAKIVEKFPPQ